MQLDRDEIHLWQARQQDFDAAELEHRGLSWLTGLELQRYRRLLYEPHRKQLLLGKLLTRSVLSRYVDGVEPGDWCFAENAWGKPVLDKAQHEARLYFNLSHSGGKLILALARQKMLGVDIESSGKPRRVSRIAQRFFSPAEAQALLQLPETEQLARFYELWTLKEAYIKACGLGLAIPLQHFSFSFLATGRLQLSFDAKREDSSDRWQCWLLEGDGTHKLALAIRHDDGMRTNRLTIHDFQGFARPSIESARRCGILRASES